MRIHLISIGGAIMHNLAISLAKKGHKISGSDDEIFEPSLSRLKKFNLLPEYQGFNPDIIDKSIDLIILGMHAKKDNPELQKALSLNIPVISFPEFMFKQAINKKRIVITGSHGKTTVTSMIMHVLKNENIKFDYLVGAELEGFETTVDFFDDSEFAIYEGDEYLTSALDQRPKFLLYKPHVAVINGISWDHANVFPEFELYRNQFVELINNIEEDGCVVFNETDKNVKEVVNTSRRKIKKIAYGTHPYFYENGVCYILKNGDKYPLNIFGAHNMINISAALEVCKLLGIEEERFYHHISTFKGAKKRLQLIGKSATKNLFLDFAHSPSKLKATINAVKELYPDYKLVAIFELYTYSSLNKDFLPEYKNSMKDADFPVIFYLPENHKKKNLEPFSNEFIKKSFNDERINIINCKNELIEYLLNLSNKSSLNILMMSSGNFGNVDIEQILSDLNLNKISNS